MRCKLWDYIPIAKEVVLAVLKHINVDNFATPNHVHRLTWWEATQEIAEALWRYLDQL